MAINPSSLLGRSQTTNPQPQTSPVSSIIPNRNVPNVTPPEREDSPEGGKTILDQLVQIKDKVLSIQKIITKNEKLFQKMEENNRKQEENERRKNKELKLEEKKEDLPIKDLENKEFPKIGLLDKNQEVYLLYFGGIRICQIWETSTKNNTIYQVSNSCI